MKTTLGKLLLMSAVCGLGDYVLIGPIYRGADSRLGRRDWRPCSFPLALSGSSVHAGCESSKKFCRLPRSSRPGVRAGHAFTTGLEMVSKESPEPIATEFRKSFDEQNFGLPLRDALLNLAERVPLIDVRFFVTALLIQKETGGNLAEILDGLAAVIRDRFRIIAKSGQNRPGPADSHDFGRAPCGHDHRAGLLNPQYIGILFQRSGGPDDFGMATVMQIIGSLCCGRSFTSKSEEKPMLWVVTGATFLRSSPSWC